MKQQQSFAKSNDKGCLYLVPTPIGNLDDMTFRAVAVLKEVDLVACEDTRVTKKLLTHFDIRTPLTSYYEHNKERSGKQIISQLERGKSVALVTDAGAPAISDPGADLVADCIESDIPIVPLPGANAAVTALIASGLPTTHFYFYGFLSRQTKDKKRELQALQTLKVPVVFYEAPHRLRETLKLIYEVWGNRNATIARELTKRYEEFIRGSLSELGQWSNENQMRGEFCIIVDGTTEEVESECDQWWHSLTVKEHVTYYIEKEDIDAKVAVKQVAIERNLPKREVYRAYHIDPS